MHNLHLTAYDSSPRPCLTQASLKPGKKVSIASQAVCPRCPGDCVIIIKWSPSHSSYWPSLPMVTVSIHGTSKMFGRVPHNNSSLLQDWSNLPRVSHDLHIMSFIAPLITRVRVIL